MARHDGEGKPYPLSQELIRRLEEQLEGERQRADQESQRANQESQRAEQERQRSAQMEQALQHERQQAENERLEKLRLLEKLRQLGADLDEL
ncbi:hypothetical protein [Calothrix rhizosoleniae]|uniref:hypothetical protein n=1 Tax=Calothrix rhizosoleniae TaxID=888997 RepID=UPI001F2722C9|nr:hypothetical protein [Calothrix rhizosoleniae]